MITPLQARVPTLVSILLFLQPVLIFAATRVALKAEALEDYVKARATDPSNKIQTYLFMKGNYYGGSRYDPSMDRLSFEELVEDIAANMRYQNYYPES